jgi:hypothetical protein
MPLAPEAGTKALIAAGRLEEAETQLRARCESHPGDADALANFGLVALRRGDSALARERLFRAIAVAPGHTDARANLAAALARLEDFGAAEQHARLALAARPDHDEARITLAEALAARGDFDAAEAAYAEAASHPGWSVAGLVRFSREFFERSLDAAEAALPPLRTLAEPSRTAGISHVLYLACSADYLRDYGGSLLESLDANGGAGALVHLHLVGDDAGLEVGLACLPERYARRALRITAESPDLTALIQPERVAFYTAARFLRVPELLAQYALPVITLDIDALVTGPTAQLCAAANGADLALMLRPQQRIAWTNVLAGALVFNPTPAAADYARLVKGYVEASRAEGRLSWNLDQVALYCSLVMMRRFGAAPAVTALNAAADRVIHQFSPLRGNKKADPLYLEYRADI